MFKDSIGHSSTGRAGIMQQSNSRSLVTSPFKVFHLCLNKKSNHDDASTAIDVRFKLTTYYKGMAVHNFDWRETLITHDFLVTNPFLSLSYKSISKRTMGF